MCATEAEASLQRDYCVIAAIKIFVCLNFVFAKENRAHENRTNRFSFVHSRSFEKY